MEAVLAPSISDSFKKRLNRFDSNLKTVFNCETERFEIHRWSGGRWHWVIAVENEDETFRPLDGRIFKKLYEMDIIARFGSIANYTKHLDDKQKKWQDGEKKKMDYEMREDIKADKSLWQKAAENAKSGLINPPPEERVKKIISYPGGK